MSLGSRAGCRQRAYIACAAAIRVADALEAGRPLRTARVRILVVDAAGDRRARAAAANLILRTVDVVGTL